MATFDRDAAKQAGYSDQEINTFLKKRPELQVPTQPAKPQTTKDGGFLHSMGLGPIVDTVGGFKDVGFQLKDILMGQIGTPEQKKQAGEDFLERQRAFKPRAERMGYKTDKNTVYTTPTGKSLRQSAGTALTVAPVGGATIPTMFARGTLRGIGSEMAQSDFDASSAAKRGVGYGFLETIPGVAPYLTKRGTAKLTEKAVAEATKKGKGIDWGSLTEDIERAVYKKLGKTKEVVRATNKIVFEKAPEMTPKIYDPINKITKIFDQGEQLSPNTLLDWRRQILAREGGNSILKFLKGGGSDIEGKVASVARSVISKNLKQLAPGAKIPDLLYSLYSKGGPFGGSPPTIIAKYLIGKALLGMFGKELGNMMKGFSK